MNFVFVYSIQFIEFKRISHNYHHRVIRYRPNTCAWICVQEATGASYAATVKTIRQVKTVFVIFISFVSCWTPYVVVLLYDSSDSLPLTVHLFTSMLAHLHANLNFAIYSFSSRAVRAAYRRLAARVVAYCRRRTTPNNSAPAAAAAAASPP